MKNKIIHGDSLKVLKKLKENSVDLIVTDPPYGIGFMGKAWDTFKPAYIEKKMAEDARPKKGIASARRSNAAGTYDNSKKGLNTFQQFMYEVGIECLRVLKPGAFMFMSMTPRQDCVSRVTIALEDSGFNMGFTSIYWTYASGFPKASNIGKMVDKRLGVEREITGYKSTHINRQNTKNWKKSAQAMKHGAFKTETSDVSGGGLTPIAEPATYQAKELDGSYGGFQPKPAVEIILVAMKPITEKTYVDQAMKNKKGITWLDDCRVPYESKEDTDKAKWGKQTYTKDKGFEGNWKQDGKENVLANPQGRFPANLLVQDNILGEHSRYFNLDTFPFMIVPKASKSEKNPPDIKNIHPTTKPIKLMSYLILLGSREKDLILDPFVGSGTTCVAAKILNRDYIGIDLEREYCEIAEARLSALKQQTLL